METKQVTKPETSKHLCVEPNKKPEIHEINNFFKTASVIIWSLIGAQDWGSSPSENVEGRIMKNQGPIRRRSLHTNEHAKKLNHTTERE